MLNGPNIKKEWDQLLISNKIKDVLYESIVKAKEAELARSNENAAHDKEIFEERLRSEKQEKERLIDTHDTEIKYLHNEKGLKNLIELEYTNFHCIYTLMGQKYEFEGSVRIQHLSTEYYVRPRYL